MTKEQQTLLAVGEESIKEQEDLSKYNNMPIDISEESSHLAREKGLDDPLDEQATCALMLKGFNHCQFLYIFH